MTTRQFLLKQNVSYFDDNRANNLHQLLPEINGTRVQTHIHKKGRELEKKLLFIRAKSWKIDCIDYFVFIGPPVTLFLQDIEKNITL